MGEWVLSDAGDFARWHHTQAFGASGERDEALLAAIALALDFQTWRTLVRQQELSEDRAVGLMVGMVRCLMST